MKPTNEAHLWLKRSKKCAVTRNHVHFLPLMLTSTIPICILHFVALSKLFTPEGVGCICAFRQGSLSCDVKSKRYLKILLQYGYSCLGFLVPLHIVHSNHSCAQQSLMGLKYSKSYMSYVIGIGII